MEELFYSTDRLEVFYLPNTNIGLSRWNGFSYGDEYRNAMDKIIEFYTEKKITKILANLEKFDVITDEDQKWTNETWFPKLLGAGVKRMAVVVSQDAFSQMSVEDVLSKVESLDFVSQFFNSEEAAHKWLEKA